VGILDRWNKPGDDTLMLQADNSPLSSPAKAGDPVTAVGRNAKDQSCRVGILDRWNKPGDDTLMLPGSPGRAGR
jgi:hypothetical protein